MIITDRDRHLVRDIALSHVLSRDQILGLSYFSSVSRANRRLQSLCESGLVRPLSVPFEQQRLYVAGAKAAGLVGERIAVLLENRGRSPRFLQHALMVTDVRIELLRGGNRKWRFEPQVRDSFSWAGRSWELRPDGVVATDRCTKFVEVDLGHVSSPKFSRKLRTYVGYVASGRFESVYGDSEPGVLVVTTGSLRRSHLARDVPNTGAMLFQFDTFDGLGIKLVGSWS